MNVRVALGGMLTLALGACGPARESTTERASLIISGVTSPSPDDDAVVLLRHLASATETICSAILVAPNLVVTARHCVSYGIEGTYQCSVTGELVEGPDGGGHIGADVPAAAIEIHVGEVASASPAAFGKQVVSTLSLTSCIDDLAFVVLDQPLKATASSIRLGKQTRPGESVTLIGYGKQDNGPLDWHTNPRKKLLGPTIAAVGPDSAQGGVPMLVPRSFEIKGPSACEGDSGGPALSQKTGALVGTYSNKNSGNCTNPDIVHTYVNISPFERLALQAFAAAGAEPLREAPGLPMGDVCQEADDCERGDCATGSDGTLRCTVACGSVAPCQAGYSCVAVADAGGKICMQDAPPSCPCGAPTCAACDAGSLAPVPAPNDGGCTLVRGQSRPGVWQGACLAALAALARRPRSRGPLTCRRAYSRRRASSRCPTCIRTAG